MLVNFSPNITTNKLKTPSFKANPYINTRKIASEAEAYHFERLAISTSEHKILRTAEEEADLNSTIQRCLADGQKTVVAILNRAKSKWPVIK